MIIFYARSMTDYNSDYETEWIKSINDTWTDCEIIKFPSIDYSKYTNMKFIDKITKIEQDYFYPLIDKCNIIIASPSWNHNKRGKYTHGTLLEIKYAVSIGKKVIGIINNELTYITSDNIKYIS